MKFNEKYPAAVAGGIPEAIEPLIELTQRLGRCPCGSSTRWRYMVYGPGAPVCSEECLSEQLGDSPRPTEPQLNDGCTSQNSACACRGLLTKDELDEIAAENTVVQAIIAHRTERPSIKPSPYPRGFKIEPNQAFVAVRHDIPSLREKPVFDAPPVINPADQAHIDQLASLGNTETILKAFQLTKEQLLEPQSQEDTPT